jgi:16S rRNA G966 N2-methylase RsmD
MKKLSKQWQAFYELIKDPSWPEICYEDELVNMPKHILQEIMFLHLLPPNNQEMFHDEEKVLSWKLKQNSFVPNETYFLQKNFNGTFDRIFYADKIKIVYHSSLDGGGSSFGQRYRHLLSNLYPNKKFVNCFEWCSGPGFIGFDLLSRGFCKNIYFSDIFYPAIKSIEKTVEMNGKICEGNVFWSHADSIKKLPPQWKFDLVVSNPPHWNSDLGQFACEQTFGDRRSNDQGWKIHADFFANIKQHLNPESIILLQEQSVASGPKMFEPFIEQAGLMITDCFTEPYDKDFYYLEVRQK